MSKLFDAIKKCIDAFGKDIIKDKKIVNILADYHAYDGKPAFKHVFSAIVNGGYAKHLLDGKNQQVQIMRDIAEISNDYGFRKELVQEVYESIIASIQLAVEIEPEPIVKNKVNVRLSLKKIQKYEAICESYKYKKEKKDQYETDAYGALYSKDGKALVSLGKFKGSLYIIRNGTVYIANGVYTGETNKCSSLTIPSSVKAIGSYSFNGIGIEHIDIPTSVEYIGEGAFCSNEKMSGKVIHEGVEYVGAYAFCDTNVDSVTLPSTLCQLGGAAFPAGSVVDSRTDNYIFSDGHLINLDRTVLVSSFSTAEKIDLPDTIVELGDSALASCDHTNEIVLNEKLEKIGEYVFPENLKKIKIGNHLRKIGKYAFQNCRFLEEIEFPSSLETIGDYAFEECSSLCVINIPRNVKKIGQHVFSSCEMLSEITCDSPDFMVENDALYDKKQKRLIVYFGTEQAFTVKKGTQIIDEDAFKNNVHITIVELPKSIKEVPYMLFCYCPNLKEVYVWNPELDISSVKLYAKVKRKYLLKNGQIRKSGYL
jgi:hypothetical protein